MTSNLFSFPDSEPISEVDITVDLPRVSIGLFQCGVKKNIVKSNHTDHITANMGLLLIDRAFIQSKLIPAESVSQDFSADTSNLSSTLYQLNGSAITVQLLQLTNRDAPDFGSSGTATTPNNWEHCAISRRMNNLEPRVMMDFNVSDTLIILERRPIILLLPDKSTTAITPIHSPANAPTPTAMNRTPTLTLTPSAGAGGGERAEPMRKKKKMICEHYLKADIGSVTTALVMARPQELTAGDEFPIYEALAPVMVSWLSVVENFLRTVDKFIHTVECWKSVAMAKVLKLALDSTDEKVVVKVGKNRMGRTRVLSAHQASCPSCILLKTLFRWFAYAGNAPGAINHRLDIRPEFEIEETRKTALMALLSHWQSDVGKELKLVSYEDAHRFKVTRPDEAAIVALTKSKRLKRKMLEKKESSKKETRVVMEVKPEQWVKKMKLRVLKIPFQFPGQKRNEEECHRRLY